MDIEDPDYRRTMAKIERLAADVGPRRPTVLRTTREALKRQRAVLDLIAAHAHETAGH